MTPAQLIEEEIKAEVLEGAKIADPKEFMQWSAATGYSWAAVSALTGADADACFEKVKAGSRPVNTPETHANYNRYNKPLTKENFPGNPKTWERSKPRNVLIERLAEALDKADYVRWLYIKHLNRAPDQKGKDWWEAEWERQFVAGIEA